ncbi:hypothetical protein C8J56DRAFT_959521 [Mycena floridula]|nr:hypothetical protein C8J56DRAFT_959521 [Mycena floridula]
MPPRSSQKRAATGSQGESTPNLSTKKTRFLDPSEDPTNFAEEVDSALEQTTRKGRVKDAAGYDSDSSDDGEGVVLSRRKEEKDEDDDMFAMGDEEAKSEETSSKKKKKTEYMRLGDIEGQEFGGSGSEESSEDEPLDEDEVERRKKAGMGFELSSFNMREEMEEGKFTEDGSYVRSFDPHGVHDRWMEGVDEREMKRARKRKRQQERVQQEKMQAEEEELAASGGKFALEKQLLPLLKKGETILEALQRLGKLHSKPDIEQVTHLASAIMALGDTDIYSKTYEELVRAIRGSGSVDSAWIPPSADRQFEYKWATPEAGQADEIFGPFGEEEMQSWHQAQYFGIAGEKVKVRAVGSNNWDDWDKIL